MRPQSTIGIGRCSGDRSLRSPPARHVYGSWARTSQDEFAAIGSGVERLTVGDGVYGDLVPLPARRLGGFAGYGCAPEVAFVRKPARMSFEQAAPRRKAEGFSPHLTDPETQPPQEEKYVRSIQAES